jgi:hypothetical protein
MENQPFNSIYNNFGIATGLTSLGSYFIPSLSTIYNSVSDPTAPQSLGSGYFSNDIYSANYVQGQNGWKLFYNGNFEANNGTFRGNITATSGTIGGWTIGATTLTGGSTTLNSNGTISGATIIGGTIETATSGLRIVLNGSVGKLEFQNGTSNYVTAAPFNSSGLVGINFSINTAQGAGLIMAQDGSGDNLIQLIAGDTTKTGFAVHGNGSSNGIAFYAASSQVVSAANTSNTYLLINISTDGGNSYTAYKLLLST